FNFKNLKKRIMMMNKKETSKRHIGKYAFIVPAIFLGLLIFSIASAYQSPADNPLINSFISEVLPDPRLQSLPPEENYATGYASGLILESEKNKVIYFDGERINRKELEKIIADKIYEFRF